jgi:prepilin-type N-terminal cleavage/methylation domain-containing protein
MTRNDRAPGGFSLIELIVAIAILSVMGVLIMSVINNTSSITSRTAARLDANRVARECLDLIGQDLSAIRTPYANSSVNSSIGTGATNGLQMSVNPTSVDAKYRNPHTFFWQASVSRNQKYGNLAVVGYFVQKDLQTDTRSNRLQLRRVYVEPENPNSPPSSPEYLIYSDPNNWHPTALLQKFAPDDAATDNANGQRGWVADGVLAMWVRSLDPLGNPITRDSAGAALNYTYNSRKAYIYTNSVGTNYPSGKSIASSGVNPRGYDPAPVVPAFLEVGLVCVAPRDVRQIKSLPTPTAVSPANFHADIQNFTQAVRTMNPQVKSVESFTRKYRLYPTK